MPTHTAAKNCLRFLLAAVLGATYSIQLAAIDHEVQPGHWSELLARTAAGEQIASGSFTQVQVRPELEKPLVSSGRYVYWPDTGLHWAIHEPIFFAYTLRGNKVYEWEDESRISLAPTPAHAPASIITKILNTLLAQDIEEIEKLFNVQEIASGSGWSLDLKPKNRQLKKHVTSLRCTGESTIHRIEISFKDKSSLAFSIDDVSFKAVAGSYECGVIMPDEQCP